MGLSENFKSKTGVEVGGKICVMASSNPEQEVVRTTERGNVS